MALTKIPASLLDTSSGINGLIYPTSDGTSGQFLKTDGSGNLTFATTYTDSDVETYLDGGSSTPTFASATVSGTLTVTGDLDITGDINSYNVTDLDVTDKTITLGAGQTEANSGGSGIIIDGSSASILWDETNTEWDFNNPIQVAGNIQTDGNFRAYDSVSTNYRNVLGYDSGNVKLQTGTGSTTYGVSVFTAGTERLHVDGFGRVLIGQDSGDAFNADAMLRLQRAGDRVFIQLKTDADQNSAILFGDVDDDVECAIEYEPVNQALTFSTGNNTEAVRIDSDQNVGIAAIPSGEAAAAHVLRLGDKITISEYDDGSNPEQFNLLHNASSSETYRETGYATNIQQRNGEINFKTAPSGSAGAAISFAQRMRIDNNGLVHLGDNIDTNHKGLQIYKSTNDSYTPTAFNDESLLRLHVPNAEGNYAGITYTHAGGTEFFTGLARVGATSDITDYVFQGYNGNTNAYQEYMRIDSSGKVGIQKSDPYYNLHVEEAIAAYTSNAAGSYTVDSNTIILTKYAAGNADANQNENTDDIYFTEDDFGFPNSAYGVNVVGYFYASNRLSGVSGGSSGHIWRVAGSLDSEQNVAMSFVNVVDNSQSFGGGTNLKIIGNFNSTSERFEFGVTWEYGAGGYGTVTFIGQATEAMG
jgi:hypothetical protein